METSSEGIGLVKLSFQLNFQPDSHDNRIKVPYKGPGSGTTVKFLVPHSPPPPSPASPPSPPSFTCAALKSGIAVAAAGPKTFSDSSLNCDNGLYYYKVPGYKSGAPFKTYTEFSINNEPKLVFHHYKYTGEQRNKYYPTGNTAGAGTPGYSSTASWRLDQVQTLLTAVCPNENTDSKQRLYIGQHDVATSSLTEAFTSKTNAQWVAFTESKVHSLATMFAEKGPSGGSGSAAKYSGDGLMLKDGTKRKWYYSQHGTSAGVHQLGAYNGEVNTGSNHDVAFEFLGDYGTDPNHPWTVWGDASGQHYNAKRPGSTSRIGWMAVAGC